MIQTRPTQTIDIKQDNTIKTVYCLYRVSTKGQVDKNDIPMQKQSCREFAERQPGWVIKKEFQEKGVSGFKVSANDRDAVQELKAKPPKSALRLCTLSACIFSLILH